MSCPTTSSASSSGLRTEDCAHAQFNCDGRVSVNKPFESQDVPIIRIACYKSLFYVHGINFALLLLNTAKMEIKKTTSSLSPS